VVAANGFGQPITGGGLAIAGKYARVYCQVQPLSGIGSPAGAGRVDTGGQYLHVRYYGNLNLGARSGGNQIAYTAAAATNPPPDYIPNQIVVDFDAQSEFTLPFEGRIELVGGLGEWKFGLQVLDYTDPRDYRPEWRWLSTFREGGSILVVPDFHTYIMGADPGATATLPTGDPIVPGNIIPGQPIIAGLQLHVNRNGSFKTAWRG